MLCLPVDYIVLSDHLDMLGVKLKSTVTQTRKVNCDELRERFANLVGSWRAGRHMPLTQRPWSLNCYALPILWYRCHCLDMRVGDFSKLNSTLKSWLYQDMLEKPEEMVMVRPRQEGGLGVHHIQSKSQAILIKSFIETAINKKV